MIAISRCGCSGSSCSCVVRGAGATQVTGAGTVNSPYVIDTRLYLAAGSSGTVALTIDGVGSITNPYVISASQQTHLGDLYDVTTSGATTGHVLARQADGGFAFVPPSTATPGAINKNNTLTGDGSSGSPLGVALAAGGGITASATGLAVSGFSGFSTYTPAITTSTGGTINLPTGSSITGRYTQVGKLVFLRIFLQTSLNWSPGTGFYSFSLPVAPNSAGLPQLLNVMAQTYSTEQIGQRHGIAYIEGTTITRTRIDRGDYTQSLGSGFPTWGTYAHRFFIHGWYEAA